jgi:hypothetical protein
VNALHIISANEKQKHAIPGARYRQGGIWHGGGYVEKGGERRKTWPAERNPGVLAINSMSPCVTVRAL